MDDGALEARRDGDCVLLCRWSNSQCCGDGCQWDEASKRKVGWCSPTWTEVVAPALEDGAMKERGRERKVERGTRRTLSRRESRKAPDQYQQETFPLWCCLGNEQTPSF